MTHIEKINLIDLDEEDYDTVLAPDICFSGTIRFEKPFMIKGQVDGKIISNSDLAIEKNAIVKADIKADRVAVRGSIEGNVNAETLVHVFSSGKLMGDITSKEVVLDGGCFFSGVCK